MYEYLVTRLIGDKGIVYPTSKGYGEIEVYPSSLDFPSEQKLLEQSCNAFEERINLKIAQRIAIIISAENPFEADELAEVKFEQVLDCLEPQTFGLAHIPLLSTGFIKNLITAWESSRLPRKSFDGFPVFAKFNRLIQHIDESQALFTFPDTELKLAIFRSNYWLRKARLESVLQLKCLFQWFALEALAKIGEEDITGKLMQVLGFPLGRIGQFLSKKTIENIKDHARYNFSKKYFKKKFEEIRKYRDNSVHSGFRQWDIPKESLLEYEQILTITVPRLRQYAISGLYQELETVEELWEYFPFIFSEKGDFTTDLHDNIFYQIDYQGIGTREHNIISFNM